MASRQPKWTGAKTHAVVFSFETPLGECSSVIGTYRARRHAEQALKDLMSSGFGLLCDRNDGEMVVLPLAQPPWDGCNWVLDGR